MCSRTRNRLLLWTVPFIFGMLIFSASQAECADFVDEVARDFTLRQIGTIQISNSRGGLVIHGWALDKIRVKARRKITADNPEEVKKLQAAMDFRYREIDGDIELSAEYGKGLSIGERLKERRESKASMEMVVYAPTNLPLKVWTNNGDVTLREWAAPVEIRTATGAIQVENIKSKTVSLQCPSCSILAKGIRSSLRCMGATGEIRLDDVSGKNVYTESTSGSQKAKNVRGEQLYVSKQGSILASELQGRIEFHSKEGPVELSGIKGFVSGNTEAGDIRIQVLSWVFEDKALIESRKGSITMALPTSFSGEIDASSASGTASVDFPILVRPQAPVYGPQPGSRIQGKAGKGGEQLSISSQEGNVKIQRRF